MTATGEWSYMQSDLMVFMAKAISAEGHPGLRHEPWAIPAARPSGIGCWFDGWRRVRKHDLLPVHASPLLARQEMGVLDAVFSREIPWVIDFITSHGTESSADGLGLLQSVRTGQAVLTQ
jgi:hypothetical protein